jgi:hypothetical protein
MTLIIDPKTEKGKIQLEALGWAQNQFNEVLKQYFNGKHKLLKGLKLEFRMGLDLDLSNKIKIDLYELIPEDKLKLEEAFEEVRKSIVFPQKQELPKQPEASMAQKGGDIHGTDKK